MERRLIGAALKGQLDGEFKFQVERADEWVDESLDAIETEEPALARFLESEDVYRVATANASAVYWTILSSLRAGGTLDDAMRKADDLVRNQTKAVAWRAVLNERRTFA